MTILYQSDFIRYPSAIIDVKTKNTSWLQFAMKLKKMGVKNWGFHLTLLDPTLQGVDPYDPNLDKLTITKIQMELKNNYWYYIREVYRVPSKTGGEAGYLRANRGNIATAWCIFNHFITYLEQIRQTGKSLFSRVLATGFHTAWARGSTHILFTKSDLRADEIKEYKTTQKGLPGYMWYRHPKDKDNQQDFTTLCHGNTTFSYIPTNEKDRANSIGRGKTPTFINADEVPFLAYADISIPALIASTTDSFDDAKRNNAFHGIFYSTTAGDLSTTEGKYVYEKIRSRGMFFSEMLYDAEDREDAIEIIFANSNCRPVPHVTIAFNHRQLGYTDEWLREKIATVPGTVDQTKRDFLGIWTYGSQENPIPEKYLNIIREYSNNDYESLRRGKNYIIRLHKPLEYIKGVEVALGLDTSEAIGRDSIVGVGVCVRTLETLFAFSINESNLIHFGTFLAKLLEEFPKTILIPESKSTWAGIRDQLLIELPKLGIDIGRRVYSTIVDRARGTEREKTIYREYSSGYPSESKYYPYRREFGFNTDAKSRTVLYNDVMMNVVKEIPSLIKDPNLINELSTLVERNERIDHALSGNDDHVMAMNLSHWFLRYARNLDHYGIDPRVVMSSVVKKEVTDPNEIKRITKKNKLDNDYAEMLVRLDQSTTEVERSYFLNKIRLIKKEMNTYEDTISNTVSSHDVSSTRSRGDIRNDRRFMSGLFNRFDRR